MTRETKIGLVVAGSFLCLVAIVVANKWRRGDTPPGEPEEQANKVAAITPKPDASPKKDDKATPEADKKKENPPVIRIPGPANDSQNKELDLLNRAAIDPNLTKPIAPPEFKPGAVGVPPPNEFKFNVPDAPVKDADTKKGPIFPAGGIENPDKAPGPFPIKPIEEKKVTLTFPAIDPNKIGGGDLPSFPPRTDDKKDEKLTPPIPINNTQDKKDPGFPPLTSKEQPPAFPPPKDGLPSFDPIKKPEEKKDGPPTFDPFKKPEDKVVIPPPVVIVPKEEKKPNDGFVFPPLPKKDAVEQKIPIIPSNPADAPSLPTINVGGKPTPTVNRYDPDFVECLPGETDFAQLSKRFYATEKYSDALLAYNRDNRVILKDAANIMENPPKLASGLQVLKPPFELLERDYRALIRIAAAAPVIPDTPPTVKLTPPVKIGNTTPAAIPSAAAGRYVVQTQGGERIRDIAQRYLGNADRWPEIYRLNPAVQPQFPIPMGTDLKMPGS